MSPNSPGQYLTHRRERAGLTVYGLAKLLERRWPGAVVADLQRIEADEQGEVVLLAAAIAEVLPGFDLVHFLALAELSCAAHREDAA